MKKPSVTITVREDGKTINKFTLWNKDSAVIPVELDFSGNCFGKNFQFYKIVTVTVETNGPR